MHAHGKEVLRLHLDGAEDSAAPETDPLDGVPFLLRPRGDAATAPRRVCSSLSPFGFICSVSFASKLRGEEQTRLGSLFPLTVPNRSLALVVALSPQTMFLFVFLNASNVLLKAVYFA